MKEADFEREVCDWCAAVGGIPLKLKLDNIRGFPDRTLLFRNGRIAFVELKTKKGKPSGNQELWVLRLRNLGFRVGICRTLDEVKRIAGLE